MKKSEANLIAALRSLFDNKSTPKLSVGGNVLSTLASFIPGAGSIVSPLINMVDQTLFKPEEPKPIIPLKENNNIYGNLFTGGPTDPPYTPIVTNPILSNTTQGILKAPSLQPPLLSNPVMPNNTIPNSYLGMGSYDFEDDTKSKSRDRFREKALGGLVTKNFKQYNTGGHITGNDQNINTLGIPSDVNSVAAVQNNENAYTTNGKTYVNSDTLVNPETGNTFNIDAGKLNKKFSKADVSIEDKNALDFTMNRLSKLNDTMRNMKSMVEMACGGSTKKMAVGGYTDPNGDPIPPSQNIMWQAQDINPTFLPLPFPKVKSLGNARFAPGKSNDSAPDQNIANDLFGTDQMYEASQMRNDVGLDTTSFGTELSPVGQDVMTQTNMPLKAPRLKLKGFNVTGDSNMNVPAMVLKGIALGKSLVDALTPAEKEQTILPDYRKSDAEMYATNIDYTQAKQDALGATNIMSNLNRAASTNFAQYQGRQGANYANLSDQIGRISMKEALDRNQQYVQRAGYEQGKAVDTANRQYQNRIDNQQNQANADLADQKFFSELSTVGSEFNNYQYYKDMLKNKREIANATINEGLQLIGSNYTNFGFSKDFIDKIKTGKASMDELIVFMQKTGTSPKNKE